MSRDVAKQAVDFLLQESGANNKGCRISFFGGEPLLNYDLIKFTTDYATNEAKKYAKQIYFGITTNGTLLNDEKIDYLVANKFDVTISVDGPREIHDINRFFKNKKKNGSYDIIYPNLQRLIEKIKKADGFYCSRATISKSGMRNLCNLLEYFSQFDMNVFAYDFIERGSSTAYAERYPSQEDVEELGRQLEKARLIIKEKLENGIAPFHLRPFMPHLKAIHTGEKMHRFCSTIGSNFASVSCDGSVFLCHRFVGTDQAKIGNVWDGIDRSCLDTVKKIHIYNSDICSKCWARYICGGNCPNTNFRTCGSYSLKGSNLPLHCDITKIMFEQAMFLYLDLPGVRNILDKESIASNNKVGIES